MVWNLEKIKSAKDHNTLNDSLLQVLKEHENQIDCLKWAPLEANYTIDGSDYNRNYLNMLSLQNQDAQGNGSGEAS